MINKTIYNLENLTSGDHKNIPANSLVQIDDYDGNGKTLMLSITDNIDLENFDKLGDWLIVYPFNWTRLGGGFDHEYDNTISALRIVIPDISPFKFKILMPYNETQFSLPLDPNFNYRLRVEWGDGTNDVIDSATSANRIHTYPSQTTDTLYDIEIFGICEAFNTDYFNNPADATRIIEVTQMGELGWKSCHKAFAGCTNLGQFRDDKSDLENVEDFSFMFAQCTSLTHCLPFNTSNAKTLERTWMDCTSLTNIPTGFEFDKYDLRKCVSLLETFYNCQNLSIVNSSSSEPIDASNVLDFRGMFASSGIERVNILTDSGEVFARMFYNCSELRCLRQINTLNATNTNEMFDLTPKLGNPNQQEQATILNGANWVNQNNRPCPGVIPSKITDFSASDDLEDEITVTFSEATGSPVIKYDLYSTTEGLIQSDITSPFTFAKIGTDNYYVKAYNYAGETNSNTDSGTGISSGLYLELEQSTGDIISLEQVINDNNPTNKTEIVITNNYVQPTIQTGNIDGLDVTLINNGEIQGNTTYEGYNPNRSSTALIVNTTDNSAFKLINNGWIRAAGGNGGAGGAGGKGSDKYIWSYYDTIVGEPTEDGPGAHATTTGGDITYRFNTGYYYGWEDTNGLCQVNFGTDNEAIATKSFVTICNDIPPIKVEFDYSNFRGTYSKNGVVYEVYDMIRSKNVLATGGAGGAGGAGGIGRNFFNSDISGETGQPGQDSNPPGGNKGGKGGDGGNGGDWGQPGLDGQQGQQGEGQGDLGQPGEAGSPSGNSIWGVNYLAAGSETGNLSGPTKPAPPSP